MKRKRKNELNKPVKSRLKIEQELFGAWQNGRRSLESIVALVDALLDVFESRLKSADDSIVRHNEAVEIANDKINNNKITQTKMGFLSVIFGKREKLLNAQALCLQEKYINATQVRAWQFAKELLQQLRIDIGDYRSEVTRFKSTMTEVQKTFKIQCEERCNDEDNIDYRQAVIRFYKPAKVKEFTNKLIHESNTQFAQASRVRQVLIGGLGERPSFSSFNKRMLKQKLLDSITACCEEEATNAHNNLVSSDKQVDSQFGISIIEKLAKEYSGNDGDLKLFINELSSHAGNYLEFNDLEVKRQGPGITNAPTKVGEFTIILPKALEWPEFVKSFKKILNGSINETVELLECESNPREIVFVGITNLFPLRYIKQIAFLKQHYDKLISNAGTNNRTEIELHGEGMGKDFPPLFIASG